MDALNNNQRLELLATLAKLTREGRVSWQPMDGEYRFEATFGSSPTYNVDIASQDEDDRIPFIVRIFVETGPDGPGRWTKLDEFTTEFTGQMTATRQGLMNSAKDLYVAAKRQALNIDTAVTGLFGALAELDGGSARSEP